MASLTIQDTFEPYYAGRDDFAKKPARKSAETPPARENTDATVASGAAIDRPRDPRAMEH